MGKLIEPANDIFNNGEIGDWAFSENDSHILICLPPGGKDNIAALGITGRCEDKTTWEWDGNRDRPTLSPSILDTQSGWHGYLRGGILVEA